MFIILKNISVFKYSKQNIGFTSNVDSCHYSRDNLTTFETIIERYKGKISG